MKAARASASSTSCVPANPLFPPPCQKATEIIKPVLPSKPLPRMDLHGSKHRQSARCTSVFAFINFIINVIILNVIINVIINVITNRTGGSRRARRKAGAASESDKPTPHLFIQKQCCCADLAKQIRHRTAKRPTQRLRDAWPMKSLLKMTKKIRRRSPSESSHLLPFQGSQDPPRKGEGKIKKKKERTTKKGQRFLHRLCNLLTFEGRAVSKTTLQLLRSNAVSNPECTLKP